MRHKRRPSWKKVLLIALNCVLAMILLVLSVGTIWVEIVLGGIQYDPDAQPTLSDAEKEAVQNDMQGSTIDPTDDVVGRDEVVLETQPPIVTGKNIYNFLLVGQDRRPGETRARSDSMILVTVNINTKTVTLTSIMRDMYVQIPGYRDNRINVAYNLDGINLLYKTIKHNFGLQLDNFIEVDFNGFVEVIDLLGGIDVSLTEKEAIHLNNNEYYYGFDDENWNLQPGMNHLDGKQALAFSRVRRVDGTGDFGRTERQRLVLTKLFEKVKDMDWGQLMDLITVMTGIVTTDMSSNEILSYAYTFLIMMDDLQIVTQRIPADGTYSSETVEGVGSVLIPNLEANREVLMLTQQ